MEQKKLLGLAVRIIAVLLIVWSVNNLVQMSAFFLLEQNMDSQIEQIRQFLLMFLPVLLMLVIAVVLMKSADSIAEKAYPGETMDDIDELGIFNLAMKIIGLLFMVWAIPYAVQIISHFYYISYVPAFLSHHDQTMYIVDHLPKAVLFLLLGWYLLKDGRLFSKIAFGDRGTVHPSR